jgi:hypothetical protein
VRIQKMRGRIGWNRSLACVFVRDLKGQFHLYRLDVFIFEKASGRAGASFFDIKPDLRDQEMKAG